MIKMYNSSVLAKKAQIKLKLEELYSKNEEYQRYYYYKIDFYCLIGLIVPFSHFIFLIIMYLSLMYFIHWLRESI